MSFGSIKHPLLVSLGHKPRLGTIKHCLNCNIEFYAGPNYSGAGYCSKECYWISLKNKPPWNKGLRVTSLSGSNNSSWKDNPSYDAIHKWIHRHYGKATMCEIGKCLESKRYEWALIKNKSYEKKRENFIQLCTSCHHKYDDSRQKAWKTRRTANGI